MRPQRKARGNPAAGAAGAAVGAIVCGLTFAVWVVNPYAAALLLPAAHLWLLLGAPQTRMRGALGLGRARRPACWRPALVLVAECQALRIDPLELARLWLVATAGGHVSMWAALAVGALCGCVAALVRVLLARRRIVRRDAGGAAAHARAGELRRAGLARRHRVGAAAYDAAPALDGPARRRRARSSPTAPRRCCGASR